MARAPSAAAKAAEPAQATTEKMPKVYLTIPTDPYVRKDILRRDGKTFNEIKLPSNMVINGREIGNGWSFNPLFVNESKHSSIVSVVPLLADREVTIKRDVLMFNSSTGKLMPMRGPDGKALREMVRISPQELEKALTDALTAEPSKDRAHEKHASLNSQKEAARTAETAREQNRGPTARGQSKAQEIGG